jgi:hypothetical protein
LEEAKIVSSPTPSAGLSKKVLLGCKHGALEARIYIAIANGSRYAVPRKKKCEKLH